MTTPEDTPLTPQGFEAKPVATGKGSSDSPLQVATFEPRVAVKPTPHSFPVTRALLAALGLLLVVSLGFLLTARSVDIRIEAETPTDIQIDGLALPLGSRWLLRPGNYTIAVEAPGYALYRDQLRVTEAASQQLDIQLAPLPGRLGITSQPSGAVVILDGDELGVTPLRDVAVTAGSHELIIDLPRYQLHTQALEVTGRDVQQTIAVDLQPDWAEVSVRVLPESAQLWIDDVLTELGDEPLQLLSGQRELRFESPGYIEQRLSLDVTAGEIVTLNAIELLPADGVLTLASEPSQASVTVNGTYAGRTPLDIDLRPGVEHTIGLSKAGYQRNSLNLQLEQGTHIERTVILEPRLGDVQFTLSPVNAELIINGKVIGRGSQTLALASVEQRIEVRLEGYATERRRVTPRPGLEQAIRIELLTEAEARKAALQPEITSALGQTLILIDPLSAPMNEFVMGASRRESGRRSNEVEHTVRLERAFYIATTETTNAQFRQFLASHDSGQIEGNSLNREHQPVVQVSWQQAARFCNWLSAKEGLPLFYRETQGIVNGFNPSSTGYRLPTEAEWAFTARVAGEGYRRFAWGDIFPPTKAVTNVADNTSALVTGRILNGYADGHIVAAPVASFPANHRGIYDLGGNVAEWIHDVYAIPSANAEVAVDPLGALQGDNYVVRGASWALSRLSELRLTARDYGAAGRDDLGFRIARYAE